MKFVIALLLFGVTAQAQIKPEKKNELAYGPQ